MPAKNQHYVPRVYIKSWETTVFSLREPHKPFQGVYEYLDHSFDTGNGITKEKVLCGNHTYTIDKEYFFVVPNCHQVALDFGNKIKGILNQRSVTASFQGRSLLDPLDLGNELPALENWSFSDVTLRNGVSIKIEKAIKNQISDLRSYTIEDRFSTTIENDWQSILSCFLHEVQYAAPMGPEKTRTISPDSTNNMLISVFLMAFRNPDFDFAGVYPSVEKAIILPLFESLSNGNPASEWNQVPKILRRGYWITEVYKALFGNKKSAFDAMITNAKKHLKFMLFEANCDGEFITSDNPAFFHISNVESKNNNAIYLPLSPKHLLSLVRTDKSNLDEVAYRSVDLNDLRKINRIILNESRHTVISSRKHIAYLI